MPLMEVSPWHAKQSFLSSGWHNSSSYTGILSDSRLVSSRGLREGTALVPPSSAAEQCRTQWQLGASAASRLFPPPRCVEPREHLYLAATPHDRAPKDVERVGVTVAERAFKSEADLAAVLSHATNMKWLRLGDQRWISASFLQSLGTQFSCLQELCLRNTETDDAVVASFADHCPDLQCLDLSHCDLTDIGGIARLENLRELSLACCQRSVTPQLVSSLSSLRGLDSVDFSFCSLINDECLAQLASGCQVLTRLSLAACPLVSHEGLLSVSQRNPSLQFVCLALNRESFLEEGMSKVPRYLRKVQHLDFSGSRFFWQVPQWTGRFCDALRELSFASVGVSGEDVKQILHRCRQLELFDITSCEEVTEESLLEGVPQARALRRFVLHNTPKVSDEVLAYLRERCPTCVFDRRVRAHADPDDFSYCLRAYPKSKAKSKGRARSVGGARAKSALQRRK